MVQKCIKINKHRMNGGKGMRTLLAFASKYGATKQYVKPLANMLDETVDIIDLKDEPVVDMSLYDKIVVFTPVYAGDAPKYVKKFGKKYSAQLMEKPFGICFCCMTEIQSQILGYAYNTFGRPMVDKCVEVASIGGVFQYDKMSMIEKQMLKVATKNQAYRQGQLIQLDGKTNFSTVEEYKMQAFANKMNSHMVKDKSGHKQ